MNYPKDWKEEKGYLVRTFEFEDFYEAIDFVNGIAPITKRLDHHPDIEIFSYKKVKVRTMDHESDAITEKDISLAQKIDNLYGVSIND